MTFKPKGPLGPDWADKWNVQRFNLEFEIRSSKGGVTKGQKASSQKERAWHSCIRNLWLFRPIFDSWIRLSTSNGIRILQLFAPISQDGPLTHRLILHPPIFSSCEPTAEARDSPNILRPFQQVQQERRHLHTWREVPRTRPIYCGLLEELKMIIRPNSSSKVFSW